MEARGHIHTDFGHVLILGLSIAVMYHAARGVGGWLAGRGMVGPGKVVSGFFTFG